ncbi:RluA family pseudouridine synthase [Acaricomes phytoseiuli]|uniref:RluA family pseudouridine synthase n=1 Tax=Acaricomes phytoseiuli TaxID=291968 RepID=UPI00036B1EF2|nr:RluA family pseudouridine synthase [Acaricomes phytoseiuli]MCW1249561.1 RluA family pseudouridine synthase [Acaricomes phytoseiuli]
MPDTSENNTVVEVTIPDDSDGRRADSALAPLLGLSRSTVAGLLSQGRVRGSDPGGAADSVILKSTRLAAGAKVRVDIPEPRDLADFSAEPPQELEILLDDPDFVVVDKPVGVAAHPSPGWVGPTVVGALQRAGYRISTSGAAERAGIVHRLDVGTSGVMVVAKTEAAYTALKRAFKDRTVEKTYHAVVQGLPDPLQGTIDAPIGRHPGHDWKFAVIEDGRPSITHYQVAEAFGRAALLDIRLETGRTHQIRVHFAALGHPCVGDQTYGADSRLSAELGLTRQWLHARSLGFEHPLSGDWVEVTSEYPADLDDALEALRG